MTGAKRERKKKKSQTKWLTNGIIQAIYLIIIKTYKLHLLTIKMTKVYLCVTRSIL